MEKLMLFGEVLDAVDRLSLDDQEDMLDVLNRRIIERRREAMLQDIREAQKEFSEGGCRPTTVDELMKEILE